TNKIAIFYHVALWAWASPPNTGNFVPEGESAPEGVHPSRATSTLSRFAETSYAINTEEDDSFYINAKATNSIHYVQKLPGWNKYKKIRRNWQECDSEFTRRRFIFSSRLVTYRTPMNSKEGEEQTLRYKLHPWIQQALSTQKTFIANPEMPAIVDYDNGRLKMLRPTDSRYFNSGDIVWFSFALTFEFTNTNWMPEYKPTDFVRVGNLPSLF
ncbi:hypothetical protein DFH06DRAFT_1005506, partial [Mycena polygramma]